MNRRPWLLEKNSVGLQCASAVWATLTCLQNACGVDDNNAERLVLAYAVRKDLPKAVEVTTVEALAHPLLNRSYESALPRRHAQMFARLNEGGHFTPNDSCCFGRYGLHHVLHGHV
jgi:hypothetical protein